MSLNNAVDIFERRLINLSNDLNYNGVKFTIFGNTETNTVVLYATNVIKNRNLLLTELANMGSEVAESHDILVEATVNSSADVNYENEYGQCLVKV